MEEKEINATESLAIINAMINTTKNKLADDGFYFILWGWLITFCALGNYFMAKAGIENADWIWAIFPPLGGIVSAIYGYKEEKTRKVKTHIDTYLGYLWGGFAVSMVIVLLFLPYHGMSVSYFFLMILYGFATFVTGGLLSFRPLVIGSLFSFAFALLSVFMSDLDQFLCLSGSLIFSYIIPGHMLRSSYKSQNV